MGQPTSTSSGGDSGGDLVSSSTPNIISDVDPDLKAPTKDKSPALCRSVPGRSAPSTSAALLRPKTSSPRINYPYWPNTTNLARPTWEVEAWWNETWNPHCQWVFHAINNELPGKSLMGLLWRLQRMYIYGERFDKVVTWVGRRTVLHALCWNLQGEKIRRLKVDNISQAIIMVCRWEPAIVGGERSFV